MRGTHFHIKNMVCEHCAEVLQRELKKANFSVKEIELGKLELEKPVDERQFEQLTALVRENGFEIISDRGSRIVEQIKHYIIGLIHGDYEMQENLSSFLSEQLSRDYQQLSRLFSEVEGKSIERYFILQKIERAKELIVYGEQSLSGIAYELNYSSQQHFSRQFKKETGLSPSHFKEVKENKRTSIDKL